MAVTGTGLIDRESVASSEMMLNLIRNRRSIGKMTQDVPDRTLIHQVLEAGTWAPNHHLTEPWRFVVLEGEARNELGRVMGEISARRELDGAKRIEVAARAASKPLRSPYVIAVAIEPSDDLSIPELEEIAAGCAAVQNMLLAAGALGLAAIWRTGWLAFEPEVRNHLDLSDRARVLGFVYLGYPAMEAPVRTRRPVDAVTTWRT